MGWSNKAPSLVFLSLAALAPFFNSIFRTLSVPLGEINKVSGTPSGFFLGGGAEMEVGGVHGSCVWLILVVHQVIRPRGLK